MTNRELTENAGMGEPSKPCSLSGKLFRYLLGTIFFYLFCLVPAAAEAASGDYWDPWVTKTTTNSATINWRGEDIGSGSVEYATLSYYSKHQNFEKTIASRITGPYQHVSISGLKPDTSYIYRVRPSGNADVFGNRTFRTMPVRGPFTFIVISDSQEGHHYTEEQRFKYVADAIAKEQDVLFILHGGDYARFDDESRWATFFQVADKMLAKTTIFPTIGNHEYHNIDNNTVITAGDHYRQAFDLPLNYSFDCAGIRFISLNTPDPNHANGDDPQTSLALAQSQVPWLRGQLDNSMSGTFTIHHHPIWDDGKTTTNADLQPWEDLFQAHHISADFAGHTHNYQRFQVEGTPYFISGNAGGPVAAITDTKPIWSQFGATKQLGYLRVTVDPAHNLATAQEVFVASVTESDSSETPYVYDPPIVGDAVAFPLVFRPPWKLYLPLTWHE
jgi:acid phosphatase type 7